MIRKKDTHEYARAKRLIEELIVRDNYRIGDLLPSRSCLANGLKLGARPVQRAMELLQDEGIVETVNGSGSFLRRMPGMEVLPGATAHVESASMHELPAEAHGIFSIGAGPMRRAVNIGLYSGELRDFGGCWRKALEDYEAATGVKVNVVDIPDDDILTAKAEAGELDLFNVNFFRLPFHIARGHLLRPGAAGSLNFSEKDFLSPFYDACFHDGVCWGVPLAVGGNCLFYNKSRAKDARSLLPVEGFWNFLERAENLAHKLSDTEEALIVNDYMLPDFFANCVSRTGPDEISSGEFVHSSEFRNFVGSFERFFFNMSLFEPKVDGRCYEAFNNFKKGRHTFLFGNSVMIYGFEKAGHGNFGIMPAPLERKGFTIFGGVANVISSSTLHPSESLELLNHIASYEVQRSFTGLGRCVAHRRALEEIDFEGADDSSRANLVGTLERGKVLMGESIERIRLVREILFSESLKWYSRASTSEDFLIALRRRMSLMSNALKLRSQIAGRRTSGRKIA